MSRLREQNNQEGLPVKRTKPTGVMKVSFGRFLKMFYFLNNRSANEMGAWSASVMTRSCRVLRNCVTI